MKNLKQIQSTILAALKEDFEINKVPVILRNAEAENIPVDILTTLHRNFGRNMDEAMGEFYFLPVSSGEKQVLYFSAMISLDEDTNPDCAEAVSRAIEVLNFYLECGAFVFNRKSGLIAYKFVTPVFAHWKQEQILEAVNMNVGHALEISERYADSLIELAHGENTLEHFMDLMPEL